MSDFIQTMRDWKRMCKTMGQDDEYNACQKCGLRDFGCPGTYEQECDGADWAHVENVVTAWAAENPEPQYPLWGDYLQTIIPHGSRETALTFAVYAMQQPIPADIAEKLGIEPK